MPRFASLFALALLLLAPLSAVDLSTASARPDDIDESSAARNVKSLLQADPGTDLPSIWKLSESLAALGRPAINPLRAAATEVVASASVAAAAVVVPAAAAAAAASASAAAASSLR